MTKIRIEVSSLATHTTSGVGNYTRLLAEALAEQADVNGAYFNFMHRQPEPLVSKRIKKEQNSWLPLRIYAKLDSLGLSLPFDLLLPRVDLTIHPNFATWPTIKSKKVATVVHDLTYLYYPELVEEKNLAHLRRVVPRSIKKSDYIITVSHAVKKELINEFNLDPNRCVVTQIPPASEFFTPSNRGVHKKYGIMTNKYILFVGNLEPRKNLSTLLDAYLLLPKETKEQYSLIIAGGRGWKFEETAKKIHASVDAGENIKQIGFVDQEDLPALMQKASVFAMPSFYEGFGMPILESLASGTPVVAADISVLRESGGDAAIYASPKDADAFAGAILKAIQSGYNSESASRHLKNFSWRQNVKNIVGLL